MELFRHAEGRIHKALDVTVAQQKIMNSQQFLSHTDYCLMVSRITEDILREIFISRVKALSIQGTYKVMYQLGKEDLHITKGYKSDCRGQISQGFRLTGAMGWMSTDPV